MYIGTVLQRAPGINQPDQPVYTLVGNTKEDVLPTLEKQAVANRKSNPSYTYRTVGGQATHLVRPPEEKIEIVDFKD